MELSWGLLLALLAMVAFAAFWHDTLGARDRANVAAKDACGAMGAALLDGTVAFRGLRVVRGAGGAPAFERTYVFDYTLDGDTRQQGFVVVTAGRIESVGLQ